MRPIIHVSVIAGLSLATFGVTQAEIEGEIHGGINSEYIFRGVDQGGGSMAEAGVDLNAAYAGFGFYAGIWYASIHDGSSGSYDAFEEIDFYGGVTKDFGFLTAELGYIYYDYPNQGMGDSEEVKFGISRSQWGFDFGLAYFWDIDGGDNDGYSELTIDRSFKLSECLKAGAGGTISYDWESGDIHHYGLTASLDWAYNEVLSVSPYLSMTFAEDGAQTGAAGGGPRQGDEFFGGLLVKAAF